MNKTEQYFYHRPTDHKAVAEAIKGAVKDLSPTRKEAFVEGVRMAIEEIAGDELVGALTVETESRIKRAKRIMDRFETLSDRVGWLTTTLEGNVDEIAGLDQRAKNAAGLAASLMVIFVPETAPNIHFESKSDAVHREAIRAISYIVWAYLGGEDLRMPTEEIPGRQSDDS